MFAEAGRGLCRRRRRSGVFRRVAHALVAADLDDHVPVCGMGMGQHLWHAEHRARRNALAHQLGKYLFAVMPGQQGFQFLLEFDLVHVAVGIGDKTRVARQVRTVKDITQLCELTVVPGAEEDITCPGLERFIRCEIGMGVAGGGRVFAAEKIVGPMGETAAKARYHKD